jgi:hypothetical protein
MKRCIAGLLALALTLGTLCALAADKKKAEEKDYWSGTWVLVPKKSTYKGAPAPKSATLVILKDKKGWEYTTVDASGKKSVVKVEGNTVKAEGGRTGEFASKPIDARTVEQEFKSEGKVFMSGRGVVAADGKTMTYTSKGINREGRPTETMETYKKQK